MRPEIYEGINIYRSGYNVDTNKQFFPILIILKIIACIKAKIVCCTCCTVIEHTEAECMTIAQNMGGNMLLQASHITQEAA